VRKGSGVRDGVSEEEWCEREVRRVEAGEREGVRGAGEWRAWCEGERRVQQRGCSTRRNRRRFRDMRRRVKNGVLCGYILFSISI